MEMEWAIFSTQNCIPTRKPKSTWCFLIPVIGRPTSHPDRILCCHWKVGVMIFHLRPIDVEPSSFRGFAVQWEAICCQPCVGISLQNTVLLPPSCWKCGLKYCHVEYCLFYLHVTVIFNSFALFEFYHFFLKFQESYDVF